MTHDAHCHEMRAWSYAMKSRYVLGLFLIGFLSAPSAATTWSEEKFVCPVGGEKFKARVVASYSTWGSRPDGRGYGTLPIVPIVECPGNGMLLIDEAFTPAELQTLNAVVPSSEYQAMRLTETPHYRAWWLMSKLGRNPYEQAWQLLQASWESDENWDRKVRYQVAFVNHALNLKRDDPTSGERGSLWVLYNLRAANALRELGHFDKALVLLDKLDKPEFIPVDPEEAKGMRHYIDALRALIKEENPSPEPATMVPDFVAAVRCEMAGDAITASERPICEDPKLAPMRKDAREFLARKKG